MAHVGGFIAGMALMQVLSFGAPANHPESDDEIDVEEGGQQVY